MRTRAIILLGEIGNEQARPVLEKVLRDADPVQRLTAARALCRLVGADSISTITELLEDPDIGVSNAAIQCLAEVGDESALAALQRFKTKSTHDFLCSQAEVAIRNIRERIA
jgi:HEAT repeat protein